MSSSSPPTRWIRCAGRCGRRPGRCPTSAIAKAFKGARWALLKNPADLTDEQAETLPRCDETHRWSTWRAYLVSKKSLREVFAGDLTPSHRRTAARPVVLTRAALPDPGVRQSRPHDPQAPGRHHAAIDRGHVQRPSRRAEHQDPDHDQPTRLRIPLRRSRPCAHHARLRTGQTRTAIPHKRFHPHSHQ